MVQSVTPNQHSYAANTREEPYRVAGERTELIVEVLAPSCNQLADGVADLTISGTDNPYQILWSDGSTVEDLTGKPEGNYSVLVTGHSGEVLEARIQIPAMAPLKLEATVDAVTCYKGNNGMIDPVVSGGTTPYTITCNGISVSDKLENLSPGAYHLRVTDAYGCVTEKEIAITDAVEDFTFTTHDVSCYGTSDGRIDIHLQPGMQPAEFSWSNGSYGTSLRGIPGGTQELTIHYLNGCTSHHAFAIAEPEPMALELIATDADCEKKGSALVNVTGGEAPLLYTWSDGSEIASLDRLEAGTYTVLVTDSRLCSASGHVTINGHHSSISLLLTSVSANCSLDEDGSIDLFVSGGAAPYSYKWSNGTIAEDLLLVKPGHYSVVVTDALGCNQSATIEVEAPLPFTASISEFATGCDRLDNGLTVIPSGGVSPYMYSWSTGSRSANANATESGIYAVTVTDANGCNVVLQHSVEVYEPLTIRETVRHPSAPDAANGMIDLELSGGKSPFIFEWSNGTNTKEVNNLLPGQYTLLVTDATGCTTELHYAVGVGYGEDPVADLNRQFMEQNTPVIGLQLLGSGMPGQQTPVRLTASTSDHYMLSVFDMAGRRLQDLVSEHMVAGEERVLEINSSDFKSGVYIVKAVSSTQVKAIKLNIIN
jgi:hypothetical protein